MAPRSRLTPMPVAWRSGAEIALRSVTARSTGRGGVFGRIPMTDAAPTAGDPHLRPKAFVGEVVPFRVTAFREGHDSIGVQVRLTTPDGASSLHRMTALEDGFDRWQVEVVPLAPGDWSFRFEAYADDFTTWQRAAGVKVAAGVDVAVMAACGAELLRRAAGERSRDGLERAALRDRAARLDAARDDPDGILSVVDDIALDELFRRRPLMSLASVGARHTLRVERERAGVGAWYEFFPRSEGAVRLPDGGVRSGTFRTAAERLPAVARMGFDVVYVPPIHPIGHTHRKGPNNALQAGHGDPGSPWAIGDASGGHDAVHPDLGTVADFRAFVGRARTHGLEVALDLALQASPDHPWVAAHPEWFTTLPDGTIAYAENPPKKYQDIYPVNFDNDPAGIHDEVLRIVRHWIDCGVRIFRVDNPHTKPLQFWERLIRAVTDENPDVVFLAEAFTRPAPMQALARAGFQQSYSYFTWRNTKAELEEFLTSISRDTADFLRPNLFVNTPDILTEFLQFGGRPAFKIRAAIAATAAPCYGVYAGFELFESVARPGSEESIDNEKYQYRIRDWAAAEAAGDSLAPYLRRLNEIRAAHPALRQLRNVTIAHTDDDAVLAFVKHVDAALSPDGRADTVIVVVNVDPHSVRQTMVHVDTAVFGVHAGDAYDVEDLVTGARWSWTDDVYVRLDAFVEPAHIVHVKAAS